MPDIHTVRILARLVLATVVLAVILWHRIRTGRSSWLQRCLIIASALATIVAASQLVGRSRRAGIPIRLVRTTDLVSEARANEAPTLALVLYNPACGRCEPVMEAIAGYVERMPGDLDLLAVAFPGDPDRVRRFTLALDATVEGVQLVPYDAGELIAALATIGSKLPTAIASPYVIVLDEHRSVVAEWEGMERLGDFDAVVDSLVEVRASRRGSHERPVRGLAPGSAGGNVTTRAGRAL